MPRTRSSPYQRHWNEVQRAARADPDVAVSTHPFSTAARRGLLTPSDPHDAITIALVAALSEVLEARVAGRERAAPIRQLRRSERTRLGRSLGLSGETVRIMLDGERWVDLPEVLAALGRTDDLGPVFMRHLEPLLRPWPHLLHKDAAGHPTLAFARASDPDPSTRDSVEDKATTRLKEVDVLDLERQAREAVTTLAAAQQRATRADRAFPSGVDWQAVERALDPFAASKSLREQAPSEPDQPDRPLPGMSTPGKKTPAEYGIENVNAAVRAVFLDGLPHPAAEVVDQVQGEARRNQIERGLSVETLPDSMIRSALWRLHSQPRDPAKRWLVHEDGAYKPGPRMLRELDEKGTNTKP